MQTLLTWLPVLKQIADIVALLTVGTLLGIGCLVLAFYLPPLRQFLVGLAVAFFAATFCFGYGVKQEREVCDAKIEAAHERFLAMEKRVNELTQKLADQLDAAKRESDAAIDKKVQEYEDRLKQAAAGVCSLSDDDLARMLDIARRAPARKTGR